MSDRNKPGNLYRRANTITAAQIKQKPEGAGGKERERERVCEREGGEEKTQINRVYLVRASNAKQRTSRSADGGVISPGHLHNSKSSKKVSPQFHRLFSLPRSLVLPRFLPHSLSPFLFLSLLSSSSSSSSCRRCRPCSYPRHTRTLNHCPANKVF